MRKLTRNQKRFVDGLMAGLSQAEAYRQAGYRVEGATPGDIAGRAYKLARTEAIRQCLGGARRKMAETGVWERGEALRRLKELAQAAMDSAVGGEAFNHQAAAVALRAIEQANKMCGYHEAELAQAEEIRVVLGAAERFAK